MRSGPPPAPKGANTKSPRPVAWVGAWTRRKQAPDRRRHPPGHLGVRNSTRLHARKRHQAGSARTCATPGEARVALARAGEPLLDAASRLRCRQPGRRLCGQINGQPRAPVSGPGVRDEGWDIYVDWNPRRPGSRGRCWNVGNYVTYPAAAGTATATATDAFVAGRTVHDVIEFCTVCPCMCCSNAATCSPSRP